MSKLKRNSFSHNLNLPDRTYSQYSDKPKTRKWLNITRKIGSTIADDAKTVRNCLSVATAYGETLEIIARIVVVGVLKEEEKLNPAIFAKPDGTQFNNQKNVCSEWSTFSNARLNDESLRFAIRAKIIKNSSFVTIDELLQAFDYLFPNGQILRLINHHDMSFSIEYGGKLNPIEQWFVDKVDFVPTPQGVRFRGFISSYGMIEFLNNDDFVFNNEEMEFTA